MKIFFVKSVKVHCIFGYAGLSRVQEKSVSERNNLFCHKKERRKKAAKLLYSMVGHTSTGSQLLDL